MRHRFDLATGVDIAAVWAAGRRPDDDVQQRGTL
jgi:hypothetical protein